METHREKKRANNRKGKYYHATPAFLKPGDELNPHYPVSNYFFSSNGILYMTSGKQPHYTVAERAMREKWNIYEVKPTGDIWYGSCWDEYYTDKPCVIIKRIGNAAGLARTGYKKDDKENTDWYKERIQLAKAALKSEEGLAAWREIYEEEEPKKMIEKWRAKINYGQHKVSKARTKSFVQEPINTKTNKQKAKVAKYKPKDGCWYDRPTSATYKRMPN